MAKEEEIQKSERVEEFFEAMKKSNCLSKQISCVRCSLIRCGAGGGAGPALHNL